MVNNRLKFDLTDEFELPSRDDIDKLLPKTSCWNCGAPCGRTQGICEKCGVNLNVK